MNREPVGGPFHWTESTTFFAGTESGTTEPFALTVAICTAMMLLHGADLQARLEGAALSYRRLLRVSPRTFMGTRLWGVVLIAQSSRMAELLPSSFATVRQKASQSIHIAPAPVGVCTVPPRRLRLSVLQTIHNETFRDITREVTRAQESEQDQSRASEPISTTACLLHGINMPATSA